MKKLLLLLSAAYCLTINAQYTKLLDFNGTNGSNPQSGLISDGTFLYGTTSIGGANSCGTIFRIKPDGTGDSTLFTFNGANGKNPQSTFYYDGTFLYGTAYTGGANYYGTIFKIKPDGTNFTTLLNFTNDTIHGCYPSGPLSFDGTFLYGTTGTGGLTDNGTIYKIKPDGTGYTKLKDFMGGADGESPAGGYFNDGTFLYGVTMFGGTNNQGLMYKIKPDGSNYTILNNFSGIQSTYTSIGTLISDGTFFYGVQSFNGTANKGRVFRIKPDGSGDTTLFSFSNTYGLYPTGSLISDGTYFYGMAVSGGANNYGVIFKIKPDGSNYTKLLDFSGVANGNQPINSLMLSGQFLYGTAQLGGTNNDGVVFKYNTACTPVTHTQSPVLCPGQSITVGTYTYNTSGTYTCTIPNGTSAGCDSIIITNLTVLSPNTYTQSPIICNGQTFTVGTSTYTAAGTYTDVIASVATGCDSTITTHLLVLYTSSSTTNTLSICSGQSVSVGTDIYTTSGTYTFTYNGGTCDSTIITNLTVNPTPTASINGNTVYCLSSNTGTTLTALGGGTYNWNTGSTSNSISINPTINTLYSVTVTLGSCSDTASVLVTPSNPIAGFSYYHSGAINYYFTDTTKTVAGDPVVSWNWTIQHGYSNQQGYGDSTSTLQNPSTILIGGNHLICLTVITQHGCTDSVCLNIHSYAIEGFSSPSITKIYPNPAQNNFTVEVSSNDKQQLQMFDITGKQVLQQTISGTTKIDANQLENGVYFIQLKNNTGTSTQKIVVQH